MFENNENIVTPTEKENVYHSYHLYPLQIDFDKFKINKKDFFLKMYKKGIKLQVHYIPIFMQPYYKKKYQLNSKNFLNAYNFYKKEVSLPISNSVNVGSFSSTLCNTFLLCSSII